MRITAKIILFIFPLILCAQEDEPEETFDASVLQNPEPDWPVVVDPILKGSTKLDVILESDTAPKIREGFRVQVFASKNKERADSLQSVVEKKIDQPVYVSFEVPLYKVRVGDCIDRRSAEKLQSELNNLGYKNAWIIRTRIEPKIQD